jgi:DNA-binding response OmpR family regulator
MGTTLVLLVDDDAAIQTMLGIELSHAGYEIVAAGDGTEALAELESDAARFRAVVTDIRLGNGPDGWQVARRARELVADMPVVYMTGDSTHDWSSQGVPESVMLAKPFAPAQLVTAVSTLITNVDTHRTGPAP